MTTNERMAPADGIWVCAACGKTAVDRYGMEGVRSSGWDESCMLNAVLCKRGNIVPGERVTKADSYKTPQQGAAATDIPDEELLRRAVRNVKGRRGTLRWVAVMGAFALGSTYSYQLCRRFGVDPEEKVRR